MLKLEFLYYDKTACKRCISTDRSVKLTLKGLKKALKNTGLKVDFKERRLPESKTALSPSVLINGKDVEKIVNENSKPKTNACSDCCRLAGHSVKCRTFNYKGGIYDYIPSGMIMEAIRISSKRR